MALDFFGVTLSGKIRQFPKGPGAPAKEIDLWVEPQETANVSKDELGALSYVSQINIEYRLGENCNISLVLTPPYEDGLRFLQSDLIRYGVGQLQVQIGYTTGTKTGGGATTLVNLPFTGFLQYPQVSIGTDMTITLTALGIGYQMHNVGGAEDKTFPKGTTWAEAVEQTLKKYVNTSPGSAGINIDNLYKHVDPKVRGGDGDAGTFFKAPPADTKQTKSGADAPAGTINKGPRNDWWFVKETIENFGFDIIIWGNDCFVVEKTSSFYINFGPAQRKHFILRGNTDPERNMYPIMSFSTPTQGVWMAPGIGNLRMQDFPKGKEKKQKDPVKCEVNAKNTQHGASQGSGIIDKILGEFLTSLDKGPDGEGEIHGTMRWPGNPERTRQCRKATGHWKDGQMYEGIHGNFQTLGVPDLRPGEAVQVGGFEAYNIKTGKPIDPEIALFNGVWGVIVVRHSVGVGGWTTNFEAVKGIFETLEGVKKKQQRQNAKNKEVPDKDQSLTKTVEPKKADGSK